MRFLGHRNALAAGASPRTPLGELTALPRLLARFQGHFVGKGTGGGKGIREIEERRGGEERGRGKEGKMGGKGGKEKERGPLPHFVKPPPSY